MDAEVVLAGVATYAKKDMSYVPTHGADSARWHATVGLVDFELLLTGPKFWDCHERVGGGGAVDLAMHLLRCDFRAAVKRLRAAGF